LVGDYSALPRCYFPEHYLKDVSGFNATKTVWAEFMSADLIREARGLDLPERRQMIFTGLTNDEMAKKIPLCCSDSQHLQSCQR
jgi:hypothetical protein